MKDSFPSQRTTFQRASTLKKTSAQVNAAVVASLSARHFIAPSEPFLSGSTWFGSLFLSPADGLPLLRSGKRGAAFLSKQTRATLKAAEEVDKCRGRWKEKQKVPKQVDHGGGDGAVSGEEVERCNQTIKMTLAAAERATLASIARVRKGHYRGPLSPTRQRLLTLHKYIY